MIATVDEVEVRRLQAQLQRLHHRLRREAPSIAGVSRSAVRVLGVIARSAGDAVQPGDIGDELHMATSNVAAALRELEAAGYVRRTRDARDRRRTNVALTAAGVDAVATHRSVRAGWLHSAIAAELTTEEQALLRAAGELIERVADHRSDAEAGVGGS
jgi:DNA-binding MarR family transcriptional regulator